jgi:hypothetical protein
MQRRKVFLTGLTGLCFFATKDTKSYVQDVIVFVYFVKNFVSFVVKKIFAPLRLCVKKMSN